MQNRHMVFDYRAQRLLMGIIAFSLPIVVNMFSGVKLTSISASYYSNARDIFVGLLFAIGTFLFAYNGHSPGESLASKVACLAAVMVALFPTNCDECAVVPSSYVHYSSATVLFSILAYFCFVPFQESIKRKQGEQAARRGKIYLCCGWVMVLCMAVTFVSSFVFSKEVFLYLRITYWGEFIALWAFGIAWMASSKVFKFLASEDERYHIVEELFKG